MPIFAAWRNLDKLPKRSGRDAQPGIYEIADEKKRVIYIGQSARDVPNRIRQHLKSSSCIIAKAYYWRYQFSRVPQAEEAKQLAQHMTKHGRIPICNQVKPLEKDISRRYSERSNYS